MKAEHFASSFNILNKLFTHYPISISSQTLTPETESFCVVSDVSDSITISHPGRTRLYRHKISNRLDALLKQYNLTDINFTGDDLIVDCGANIGEVTKALQNTYGVYAICIEPEQREVAALKQNTIPGKTHVYETLLWNENTVLNFYQHNESADSSVFLENGATSTIQKNARRLDDLIAKDEFFISKRNIKLLKVEAEGAEPEILLGAEHILKYVEYVTVDCGPERANTEEKNTVIPVLNTLLAHGFTPIKFDHTRMSLLCKNSTPVQ